ncbi:MAG: Na(+)-translocating NADH-quinone reductase subunit C [Leptospirales bacterium]
MAQHDSTLKTVFIAFAVTVVASVLVSTIVVVLKPIQDINKTIEKKRNVLLAVGIDKKRTEVEEAYNNLFIEKVIDITTGEEYTKIDPKKYNKKKLMRNSENVIKLEKKVDTIGMKKICRYQKVYIVEKDGIIEAIVVEITGKGLWGTMEGFLALKNDLNTIKGLTFYSHKETPGLGGEVDNPKWKSQWPEKLIYSDDGQIQIEVIKSLVTENDPKKAHRVSGLSGATLTTRSVSKLVRFWVGDNGYRKFFSTLKGPATDEVTEPTEGGENE